MIVPCKDEKGEMLEAAVPNASRRSAVGTEIIFCDDAVQRWHGPRGRCGCSALYPHKDIRLEQGPGVCKSRKCLDRIQCRD